MKKRSWIIGAILSGTILSLGIANIASACGGGHARHGHGNRMMNVMDSLNLNNEQRQSIMKIMQEQRKLMMSKRAEMRKIRKSLHEQASASNFNATEVQRLATAKAEMMSAMIVQRTRNMNNIRHILTAEQVSKLDSMLSHGHRQHERAGSMQEDSDAN